MTTILGAILTGGRASRFGSDKAAAEWAGVPLVAHVAAALRPHVAELVLCGGPRGTLPALPDPAPELGPLGGLLSALRHAREAGHRAVLLAPCDTPRLPAALLRVLAERESAGFVQSLPVVGLWPTALADPLAAFVARDPRRSLRGWAAEAGAEAIAWREPIANVNTVADLRSLQSADRQVQSANVEQAEKHLAAAANVLDAGHDR